ncbi:MULTISPECIES: primosomal protein DnaI [Robertmurraya]|jgi:primosomal protein DnaI|uniref:Primosomal protein DnaI n=1 Tax=Robertmurraya beringensis TaxID=641660 RepID=A0ABV6KLK7_9BACI|nr:Primosomal protein DnaI [Mycobacteroides abscessus subsp. abscessus]
MERINDTLKKLSASSNFQERYERQKRQVMQHPDIREFIIKHSDILTSQMIERNLSKLYEYSTQCTECTECPSLEGCKNIMQGYQPQLVLVRGSIEIHYDRCPRKVMSDERRKSEKLIQSMYMPKEILHARFADLDMSGDYSGRIEAISLAEEFVENYNSSVKQKGLYFYGEFGVGKSYLLGAIANELAKKKVSSMIVYFPELIRELKGSIGDSTLNDKIEKVKREPVLMIDDIGAETVSSWARDEVLGTILQFRMLENLPTFFTSNFNFNELEHHLTYSQRGEEEKMKARRLLERIRYLAHPVQVDGPNRRK